MRFLFWCSRILPLEFDDSLTYYELISKIYEYLNNVMKDVKQVEEILNTYNVTIEQLQNDVAYCKSEIEKIQNGEYTEQYIDSLSKWIDDNLQKMVAKIVKYVIFGLTNDGHFCAYIPDSWNFIHFDTIADTSDELYGHLLVEW